MVLGELPVDVLSKIVAFKLGEPKYMRLKHSNALKRIQRKYKINYETTEEASFFLRSYSMVYEIQGQKFSPSIINKQVDRIHNFKTFVEQSKTHSWFSSMTINIEINYTRASNGLAVSDYETFSGYLIHQSPSSIANVLHSLSTRFEYTFDRYLRWFEEDKHKRKFRIDYITIRSEEEEGSDSENSSEYSDED